MDQSSKPSGSDGETRAGHVEHFACVWGSLPLLCRKFESFVASALTGGGHAVIAFATAEHVERFLAHLGDHDYPWREAIDDGRLICIDVDDFVDQFQSGSLLHAEALTNAVAARIEHVLVDWPGVAVYVELGQCLLQRFDTETVADVERRCDAVQTKHDVALLCAYRFDALDETDFSTLDRISSDHGRIETCADPVLLEQAVRQGLQRVLGDGLSRGVDDLLEHYCQGPIRIPRVIAKLRVLEELLPTVAAELRPMARAYCDKHDRP